MYPKTLFELLRPPYYFTAILHLQPFGCAISSHRLPIQSSEQLVAVTGLRSPNTAEQGACFGLAPGLRYRSCQIIDPLLKKNLRHDVVCTQRQLYESKA